MKDAVIAGSDPQSLSYQTDWGQARNDTQILWVFDTDYIKYIFQFLIRINFEK
jgi:hypothetical protein